jgi:CheY-like chemotaxis protein
MRDLDPWDLLNGLASDPRTADVAAILCVHRPADKAVVRAWQASAYAVLTDPVHILEVRAVVRKALG